MKIMIGPVQQFAGLNVVLLGPEERLWERPFQPPHAFDSLIYVIIISQGVWQFDRQHQHDRHCHHHLHHGHLHRRYRDFAHHRHFHIVHHPMYLIMLITISTVIVVTIGFDVFIVITFIIRHPGRWLLGGGAE